MKPIQKGPEMDRRTLLKLLSATALVGCAPSQTESRLNVVVVGAGIVGASIAYHLAKAGVRVTVIDKTGPASHASRGTFAWINATWAKQPRSYHTINQQSVSGWRELQAELSLPVRWGGSLEWFDSAERERKLVSQIAEQAAWGEDARMVGAAELAAMEPLVDFGGASQVAFSGQAAFSGNDGAVDPVVATNAVLAAATKMGAVVKAPCELTGVSLSAGRLTSVDTSLGRIKTDRLVLATGAAPNAAEKFADTNLPQRTTPGIIAITKPMPPILNSIIAAPGVHMHQRLDGSIVLGEQDGAPDTQAHAMRLEGRPNDYPERWIAEEHAGRMLAVAEQFAPTIAGAEIDDVYIGWRPLPLDGHPVIGASPNRPDVYLAVMHSGVTLAPIVGQLAAHELVGGEAAPGLEEYRPGRNFKLVKRY